MILQFIHSLPGKKWLLKGNHDYWWPTRKKIDAFLAEKGFDSIGVIHNSAVLADGMALCGTRGWLYNAESDEDVKIVNREVGRLNASIDDGIRQAATRWCSCITLPYTMGRNAGRFSTSWSSGGLRPAILGISTEAKRRGVPSPANMPGLRWC